MQRRAAAETLRDIGHRRAVVPLVIPVIIAALASVEAAAAISSKSSVRLGGCVGGLDFGLGQGEAIVVGGDVVSDDLNIRGREEASLPLAVLPLQPTLQLLLAKQSHHLILCYGDLSWIFRVEIVQHFGLQRHNFNTAAIYFYIFISLYIDIYFWF